MTGKTIAWYFVAFFGFIAAVNAVMVTTAVRTHSGLVTDHPYEKGLAYNRVVTAEEAQKQLGWTGEIELRYPHENESSPALFFEIKDQHRAVITPDKATATITRPTQSGMDFRVDLTRTETSVTFPAKGAWQVRVDATAGNHHYQQSKRIVVK